MDLDETMSKRVFLSRDNPGVALCQDTGGVYWMSILILHQAVITSYLKRSFHSFHLIALSIGILEFHLDVSGLIVVTDVLAPPIQKQIECITGGVWISRGLSHSHQH